MKTPPKISLYNVDCMEFMRDLPDNAYDLAIVDPPYGIGEDGGKSKSRVVRKNGEIRHGTDKRNGATIWRKPPQYKPKKWDSAPPPPLYFDEIFRVSKNQIIWGANHFSNMMPPSSGWIVWDKVNGNTDFSDCEIAFSSFNKGIRMLSFMWNGMLQGRSASAGKTLQGDVSKREKRIHPTQKPVALYKWLLSNYASEGDKIFDSHGGSMSIAIACHDKGFDLDLCELDKDYFEAGKKRYLQHAAQLKLV
jgi:site-specific DNA-methyltransferase (adenine-specific)